MNLKRNVTLFALLCLCAVLGFSQASITSINPNNGQGNPQNFVMVATDPAGMNNALYLWLRFDGTINGCNILFQWQYNQINLLSDDGLSWGTGYTMGAPVILQNSQCSIDVSTASKGGFGNYPSSGVTVTFKPAFSGTRSLWGQEVGVNGTNYGWNSFGTWTGVANSPPVVNSVSPSNSSGASQSFTVSGSSPMGSSDILYYWLRFGETSNGCNVLFTPNLNLVYLLSSDGTNWGTPAMMGSSTVLQNEQCSFSASSVGKAVSGNTITDTVNLTFTPAFSGTHPVYVCIYAYSGLNSGWINSGNWTIPTGQDQIIGYVKESPATLNPGEINMSRVTLSQAGQNMDTMALRVYHVGDPVTFRIRFGRPNQQVWVQRRAMRFTDGAWIEEVLCSPTVGISGHEVDGACLLGYTDATGFFEWNSQILNSLIGMTTVQFYLGSQTPDPAYPTTTYGPLNDDNYIGALVYFVIGVSGFPQPPVW